jgi:hypothetical protein
VRAEQDEHAANDEGVVGARRKDLLARKAQVESV